MDYRVVLTSIIHRKDFSEILLLKRKREPNKGMWSLSGGSGALETERDPMKAVVEEVRLDTCTKFSPNLLAIRYSEQNGPTLHIYFYGKIDGEPKIRENTKTVEELKWFKLEDVLKMRLAFEDMDKPIIKKFYEDFLKV